MEIRGTVGGQGYALFYAKAGEDIYSEIHVSSLIPHISSLALTYWDVTGLNGDYKLKLVTSDGSETVRNVTIGAYVPGQTVGSPPNYVSAPYNKAYLEFPDDALSEPTIVTVTPIKLTDAKLNISTTMPMPQGALYEMKPSGIKFLKDAEGKVVNRHIDRAFLPEEMSDSTAHRHLPCRKTVPSLTRASPRYQRQQQTRPGGNRHSGESGDTFFLLSGSGRNPSADVYNSERQQQQ